MSQTPVQPERRERWNSRTAFIMAAIGSAVGLGNVWRFPYMVYQNGGGAFFIPYIIALVTAGIPLMILEYGVGQMMQGSAPKALGRLNKNYEWVGWFALCIGSMISFYYAVVMAYAWQFLGESIRYAMSELPWAANAHDHFYKGMLALPDANLPDHMWEIQPWLVVGLVLTWAAVFVIIVKGVRVVGRVVLITVPLPVLLLGVLAVRGLTLEGALDGIEYYLRPDFTRLKDPQVWLDAYGQIFFSLSLGFGIMIAYASYNKRRGDITNNAFLTSLANCATSFFAGFVVFSILGFLAFKTGKDVGEVATSGPGLAFVTYPTAIAMLGEYGAFWPPLVAVLFFVMLLSLGIDSLFSIVEGVVAGLHDRFGFLNRGLVTAAFCGTGLLVGIVLFASRAGLGWLDLFDHWANYGLVTVGLIECLLVGYFFRTARLREFVNTVSEIHLGGWWELCIRLVAPLSLVVLLGSSLLKEVTEGIYGAADWPDSMVQAGFWVFFGLFVVSFLMGRRWGLLCVVVGGIAFYFLFHFGLSLSTPASLAGALAMMILFGGLGVCIAIAIRGKDVEHHEQTHGWPEREKRLDLAPRGDDDE